MELKEFLKLFKKYKVTFFFILALFILGGFFWNSYQSQFYLGSMAVNISRENYSVEKDQQQYDQFYRLQADEKFGDNIVNWVKDPGFINIIEKEFAKKDDWSKVVGGVRATKLSSSYVKIDFKTKDHQSAFLLGKILENKLKTKNQALNSDQESGWFKLVIDEAYIAKNQFNIYRVFFISFILGVLIGFFGILMRYYLNFSTNENRN
jgi:uncharacterized protein involved in exopolysaccharide biosynthesis